MLHVIGTYLPRLLSHVVRDPLWRMPSGEKTAYLTFDDGPDPDVTPRLLEILARQEIRATFFLRGDNAQQRPELVCELIAAGHTIGNHTYSHANAWKVSHDEFASELQQATDILEEFTGQPLRWMRPPFGRITPNGLRWCKKAGQKMVMWDVLPADFQPTATAQHIARWTETRLRPGSIVCLHDNPKSREVTPPAVEQLLPRLLDQGWRFDALSATA